MCLMPFSPLEKVKAGLPFPCPVTIGAVYFRGLHWHTALRPPCRQMFFFNGLDRLVAGAFGEETGVSFPLNR